MKEKDFNRIIVKNLNEKNWGFKISDPAGVAAQMASKNPFDGFGYTSHFNICFESKLIKNNIKAFAFNSIKPHQITHLSKIKEITKHQTFNFLCVILLGIWIPNKNIILLSFDIDFINKTLKENKKSFTKKDILKFVEYGKYISIEHKIFDINLLLEKTIYE